MNNTKEGLNCPLDYLEEFIKDGQELPNNTCIQIAKEKGNELINKARNNPNIASVREMLGLICIVWRTSECGEEVIILKEQPDYYVLVKQFTNTNAPVAYRTPRKGEEVTDSVYLK